MRNIIIYFYKKYNGNDLEIYNAICKKEKVDVAEIEKIKKEDNSNLITIVDKDYPNTLKKANIPPFVVKKDNLQFTIVKETIIGEITRYQTFLDESKLDVNETTSIIVKSKIQALFDLLEKLGGKI